MSVTPENQLDITSDQVALISCDNSDYPGNIDQSDVFLRAVSRNVTAVLFYSRDSNYCEAEGDLGAFKWIFTMKSRNDTTNVLSAVAGASQALWVTIGGPDTQQGGQGGSDSRDHSSNNDQPQQGTLGPNPSTAVAMIILYTITGVITALFLVIIVTGAVRAHRHPERYGPRAIIGRPRQSRARGIGRAILDGIPIVKFGEREEPKPTDVELGTETARNDSTGETSHPPPTNLDGTPSQPEDGIAAAGAPTTSTGATNSNDTQGCSICTEDFELGQDQRVLPCDHRFHPDCIDPWLLNVSGTCPLCRVDLRPQPSRTSQEIDENGNPLPRSNSQQGDDEDLGDLPPPIAERSSVRRSLMVGILGIRGRPDRMTREERVQALRRYREQQAARRRREPGAQQSGGGEESPEAQDRRTRRRLRTLLGIRTRRVGHEREGGEAQDGSAARE